MRNIIYILISMFFLLFCSDKTKDIGDIQIMDQQVINDLQTLEKARIFFGHQSVGFNIMDGITDLVKEATNNSFNIVEWDGTGVLPDSFFAHSRVGKNTEPNTKCDAFSEFLTADFAKQLDISFLKFCFVDMGAEDDPQQVFDYYKSVMDTIKRKYPNLTIVHLTLPLTTIQTDWKVAIKKIMGKKIGGYRENIKRYKYNNLLKEYYKDEPIFDISKIESTYPDGSRESFEQDGNTYYALAPAYTSDGGHLNEMGRKIVAKELIHTLAKTLKK